VQILESDGTPAQNDTAWENFGDEGIGTLSHAWSGAPTYYLTTRVLGFWLCLRSIRFAIPVKIASSLRCLP
jgi:hypothetical protein